MKIYHIKNPYYEIFTMELLKYLLFIKYFFHPWTVFEILLTKNISPMKDFSKVQLAFFLFSAVKEDL